ncbi:CocE/NonD family hydrolase, partial [Planctomycetota bacterium]
FYIYVNEGEDGYDTVEWVARQPWCNGDVGTFGQSYLAATQNALAVHRPPHLKTMFVMVGTSNYIEDGAGRGGAFALLHNVAYTFGLASSGKEARADENVEAALDKAGDQLAEWLWAAPLKRNSPLQWAPSYQRWYQDWRAHPTYDAYWKQVGYNFEEHHDRYPDIPIYFVGSWYDLFKRGTLKSFEGLCRKNSVTKLLMGPWTHSCGVSFAGDVDFGPDAEMSLEQEAKRWFGKILKGEDTGILDEPPVKYFVMGGERASRTERGRMRSGGEWKMSQSWPPKGLQYEKFYLYGNGTLRKTICQTTKPSRFQYDPRHPVPTIGGNIDSGMGLIPRGARNQVPPANYFGADNELPLSSRNDVLSFETGVLEEEIEVTGWVQVSLWVSSEAKDTDFTAKLIDVYPPSEDYPQGYAMNLEDGILRMRFRNSREREELMEPGVIYPITIDLWAISNTFHKGHKIRLDISSSNFPMYDRNPNTGEPLGQHTHMISTVNTVYHDTEHPSHLLVPIFVGSEKP